MLDRDGCWLEAVGLAVALVIRWTRQRAMGCWSSPSLLGVKREKREKREKRAKRDKREKREKREEREKRDKRAKR